MKETLFEDILNEPLTYASSKWVIERIPFIFNDNRERYIDWKQRLSTLIGVDSKAIVFTGSSSVGYSLNPENDFRSFDETSDIDVAIISDYYFDLAWHHLRNIGTRYYKLKHKERLAIDDHRQRLIYYGTIATDKIVHILPFGITWVNAMNEMMKIDPTTDREINFRIYKDFEALKSYQIDGFTKAREILLKK